MTENGPLTQEFPESNIKKADLKCLALFKETLFKNEQAPTNGYSLLTNLAFDILF